MSVFVCMYVCISELRQIVMVAPSHDFQIIFFHISWFGPFAVERFLCLVNLKLLHKKLFLLISFQIRMMLFQLEFSIAV